MCQDKITFCEECRDFVGYYLKKESETFTFRDKEYTFVFTNAYCEKCHNDVYFHGSIDLYNKEFDEQYRVAEDIVSIDDIKTLMKIYQIGKGPLSLALGFGEITITRYLKGMIPLKENSDIIRKAMESPEFMMAKLDEHKEKIGKVAYNKAYKAAKQLEKAFLLSDKMLSSISYIFHQTNEVSPLSLQKLLYYIQGLHLERYKKALFEENCEAWTHGPVYPVVYQLFKDFKFNPIDDDRYLIFRNRYLELNEDERNLIDLVLNTFGLYSGKTLEKITHLEDAWLKSRNKYLEFEPSYQIVSKDDMKAYFEKVGQSYDISSAEGVLLYIHDTLNKN